MRESPPLEAVSLREIRDSRNALDVSVSRGSPATFPMILRENEFNYDRWDLCSKYKGSVFKVQSLRIFIYTHLPVRRRSTESRNLRL